MNPAEMSLAELSTKQIPLGLCGPFGSVLVANRGEIACRVLRSARALGLRTIAVYSQADAQAPHVKMADAAYELGPAPVAESYLDFDRVMAAIEATGAEAVHPGYGFLSENSAFAQACTEAGVVFIGPPAAAIEVMGDKAKSKRRMIDAGVPCIPGYQGEDQDDEALISAANDIGFPIMVKASAGGGGRGMRLVADANALPDAIKMARSEAIRAFGSGHLILESAIIKPRHVEIQVFADVHGHVIHLGERDCSVQRRHQKVLEEAPCPVMTPELRTKMGAAAVRAAKDVDYVGAGTVEFLLDASGEFYFLEMNTRLQVEHPVTEMVTGLDLVAMQIQVAQGDALGLTQDDVTLTGHAIEARLYAEDTSQDFLPATGPIDLWSPAAGEGIRVDSGIATGGEVSPFYDPMIAKVIGFGSSREESRRKLVRALKETRLFGVVSNKGFLIDALEREQFVKGEATTAFIEENFSGDELAALPLCSVDAAAGAVLLYITARNDALASFDCEHYSAWHLSKCVR
jgi:geranyl-CoA carboxylase alpha subunit